MKTKSIIPGIEKPVSQIAMGTAAFDVKNKDSWFELLDGYIDSGGTIIDSARGYGSSEDVLGLWLDSRGNRDQIVLVTKCGLTGDGVLPSKDYPILVASELKISLETLKTSYIDVYMLHRDNLWMTVAEILDPLNKAIANGQVGVLGASNWEYRRVTEANEYAYKHGMEGFSVVSNNISLAVPTAAFYPGLIFTDKIGESWHKETGIPLIPWSSQARGFFAGRYKQEMQNEINSPSLDGFTKRMIKVYCTNDNFERLNRAKELGNKKGGYSAVEVALAWLLNKPFPIVPIVGPHSLEELKSCVKATSLTLTEEECKWLNLEI